MQISLKNGIYLSGGGALLRGLDKRLTDKINIQFRIDEDPLHSVAKGAGIALKERGSILVPDEMICAIFSNLLPNIIIGLSSYC
jgi:actin-related protein